MMQGRNAIWEREEQARKKVMRELYEAEEQKRQKQAIMRHQLMILDSALCYYDELKLSKQHRQQLVNLINKAFKAVMTTFESVATEKEYFNLLRGAKDKPEILKRLVVKYGREGLPYRLNHPSYRKLHPKVRRKWGIVDFDKKDFSSF